MRFAIYIGALLLEERGERVRLKPARLLHAGGGDVAAGESSLWPTVTEPLAAALTRTAHSVNGGVPRALIRRQRQALPVPLSATERRTVTAVVQSLSGCEPSQARRSSASGLSATLCP